MPSWTDETIIRFINEIRRRPELWDADNMVYKDREAKRKTWARVGELFDVTADEAYAKFRNLRTYARNEQKKNKGKVLWFAYDAISFIFSPNAQNQSIDGESTGISTSDLAASDRSSSSKSPLETEPLSVYKKVKSYKDQETQTTEAPKIANENGRHIFDSPFGQHVANKLSTYDRYTRSQVEFRISKILFDADMGLFDEVNNRQISTADNQKSRMEMEVQVKCERI